MLLLDTSMNGQQTNESNLHSLVKYIALCGQSYIQ